jgi:uncharacterized membrane protein
MGETMETTNSKPQFTTSPDIVSDRLPAPQRVPLDAPWGWLAAGWRDIWRVPGISLTYGVCFVLAAALLCLGLYSFDALSLCLPLAGGVMLIGPLIAVGLYDASRRLAANAPVRFSDVALAGFAARGQLALLGAVLFLLLIVWLQLAFGLLILFLGTSGLPNINDFPQTLLLTPRGLGLLITGSVVGGVIAALVFAATVVAVPTLLVSQTDALSAARASIAAVSRNPQPMALWAALIVVIMAAGFFTMLVGLVVAFPLIGHATWHAYAEIYGD